MPRNVSLYSDKHHRFILLNESEPGQEDGIRSNQYLIMHDDKGILLDPGGFGVMPRVLSEMLRYVGQDNISAIMLSHQDPDIVGGIVTWLELTQCPIYISKIWLRFLPHYGLKDMTRFIGVPDNGMRFNLSPESELQLIPAHFLHSEGQMNVYDPIAKILFTGDIGAAMLPEDQDEPFIDDFESHIAFIEGFHRRYMGSNKAIRSWLSRIADLEIEMLAPQHGPVYRGEAVKKFLDWFQNLQCGIDLMQNDGQFLDES